MQLQLKSPRFVAVPYPCAAAASVAEDQGDSSDALEDEDDAEEDADGDADGASENKHFSTLGWVLNFDETGLDDVSKLAMLTLGYMLLGTPSAPLKKALMASGLGEAVTGYGYEDDLLQATFTVGLKGIKNAADTAQACELFADVFVTLVTTALAVNPG